MANTAFINSDQITSIASSMKTKGDNILTEYKQNCTTALNMSTECLQLSGLDTTEFFKALESIYTKLNERIAEFADFLTNTVAAEYDFTSKAIAASFNEEFANEIGGLLGISVGGAGSASATAPAISGTTGPSSNNSNSGGKTPSTTPSTNRTTMTRAEGNTSPVAVYLTEDGVVAAAPTKPNLPPPKSTSPITTPGTSAPRNPGKNFDAIGLTPLSNNTSARTGGGTGTAVVGGGGGGGLAHAYNDDTANMLTRKII